MALSTPRLTELDSPKGLPNAITVSPMYTSSSSASLMLSNGRSPAILRTARSTLASQATTVAGHSDPSWRNTAIRVAFLMT